MHCCSTVLLLLSLNKALLCFCCLTLVFNKATVIAQQCSIARNAVNDYDRSHMQIATHSRLTEVMDPSIQFYVQLLKPHHPIVE